MAAAPLLDIRDAGRRIDDGWIWQELSFRVAGGDRLAIVGPSGSGKTLLLRALAGLDRLDAGTIIFQGTALADLALPAYRARVVYLPQRPALLEGTVEANLRAVFDLDVHADKHYDADRIAGRLDILDRDAAFLERKTGVLSGGEQQMVAFLRALQVEPAVLLLDEPTASIDAANTRQIEALVADWLDADAGRAVLWTSHAPDQIARVTDRQIELGKDEDGGSKDEA